MLQLTMCVYGPSLIHLHHHDPPGVGTLLVVYDESQVATPGLVHCVQLDGTPGYLLIGELKTEIIIDYNITSYLYFSSAFSRPL